MNISYNWLKDLINIELAPEVLAERLTGVGMAVEGVHPNGDDYLLDIDLTSNRPDCLSHLGVAREIGVITGKHLTAETQSREEGEPDIPFPAILAPDIVKIEDADLCHRFTARIIRNVKIGPSPEWLVQRLEAIGERSINNVADITNYVMHELGQPMHSFDLDKLTERRIVVRRAKVGEKITTLDDVERKLDETMLAICDAEKPVAVGGVMGGLDSSITDQTMTVLLEVAYFKRETVRATSRKLGLTTEASYRFERGVDIENVKRASDRATQLISELAGGEAGEFVDVYPTRTTQNEVESADISAAVKRLTGLEVTANECLRILSALGISNTDQPTIFVAPTWRHDVAIEEDLVEEVARHAGYENIKDELPPAYGAGEYQATEVRKKLVRRTLVDNGFDEAIGYSFIDTKHDGVVAEVPELLIESAEEKFITLNDSVIEGAVRMRPTLLPGLLDSIRLNFNHQRRDLKLFELGKVFAAKGEKELPRERELFAMVITGGEIQHGRSMPVRELDFYDAKGAVESTLEAVGISHSRFEAEDVKHLRKGQSASITVGEEKVGFIGRLNEEISANYKFRQPVYVAEIDLDRVLDQAAEPSRYTPLPRYPSIVRDVSFLIDRGVFFDAIHETAMQDRPEILQSVNFVDVYEGKGLGENERSLTIRFEYRSDERTLVEEEVTAAHDAILAKLGSNLGIRQRS
jgi:phenylalanyl-tRNA synthetase beta chain